MKKTVLLLPFLLITMLIPFASADSDERPSSEQSKHGENIFNASCSVCHVNEGNVIDSRFPLKGSQKLSDFKTFLSFIRDPKMPDGSSGTMPSFSESQISDKDVDDLYQYFVAKSGMNLMKHSSDK
jgi:mono/diheme cytochrome c family protein